MGREKLTTETFIKRANKAHKERYTYESAIYKTAHVDVIVTCKVHGDFKQRADDHLHGHGCPECGTESQSVKISLSNPKVLKINRSNFIKKARKVHRRKYTYGDMVYKGGRSKLTITCPFHGNFEQRADSHLSGSGCMDCHLGVKPNKETQE